MYNYHRIIEWHGLTGPLKSSGSKPPATSRDTQTMLLKAPSNLAMSTARGMASTASLDDLFQHLTPLIAKNLFLVSDLNPLSFSLKPIILVLPCFCKKVPLQPHLGCLQVWEGFCKVSTEPSLLWAEPSQFPKCLLMGKVLHLSNHLGGLPLEDHSNRLMCFLCWGTPQLDAVIQVGSSITGGSII